MIVVVVAACCTVCAAITVLVLAAWLVEPLYTAATGCDPTERVLIALLMA